MHPENVSRPIEVTLFGMVTDERPVHSLNVDSSIEVKLFGMITDARLVHFSNAEVRLDALHMEIQSQ